MSLLRKSAFLEIAVIRIIVVLLQLIFLKIYTNFTPVYEIGIFLFLLTISYSLNAFLLVPLDYFQQSQVYVLKESGYSLQSFFKLNLWILKVSTCLFVFIELFCFIFKNTYCVIITLITLLALSSYFVNLTRGIINNLEKQRQAVYCLLLEGSLKIIFFMIFKFFFEPSATIILLSLLCASIFSFLVLSFLVSRLTEFKSDKIQVYEYKKILSFSYPISIGAVINWIQLQGYRMILVPLGLVEVVGLYGTVSNVGASGMNAFSIVFSQLFIPKLYKSNGQYIKTYLRNAFFLILLVLVVGYILSPLIVKLLTNSTFVKYSSVIVFGILSEAGNFIIGALTIYLTIHNLTKYTIKVNILGFLVFCSSFLSFFYFNLINIYTVGLPIVLTQFVIVSYLLLVVYTRKKNIDIYE